MSVSPIPALVDYMYRGSKNNNNANVYITARLFQELTRFISMKNAD